MELLNGSEMTRIEEIWKSAYTLVVIKCGMNYSGENIKIGRDTRI